MGKNTSNLPAVRQPTHGVDDQALVKNLMPIVKGMQAYHRHEVQGIDYIPKNGRCLVIVNHSLATYDIFLLLGAIYFATGRISRPLIDRLFFKVPFLGDLMDMMGAVQGSQDGARELLAQENIVAVAPGGMREALRPSEERYQIRWEHRFGFARLAMESGAPVVLAACPRADDLYDVYSNPLTKWAYKNFKVPLFLARGIGFSPLPRPIKLVHFLSEPIKPPKPLKDPEAYQRQVKRFHDKLVKRMQDLIGQAIAHR